MAKELTEEIRNKCDCTNCTLRNACKHAECFRRYPFEFGGIGACERLYEKKYLVTTATTDIRVKNNCISNVYTEEVLRHSDYKNFIPEKLHDTTVQVDKILGINSTNLAENGEYIEWITTITRIA